MKLACFEFEGTRYIGQVNSDRIFACGHLPDTLNDLASQWHDLERFQSSIPLEFSQVVLLPPVPRPEKVICVGRNYAAHAAEMGSEVQDLPVIFNKFPTSIAASEQEIRLPAISEQVDFEAELVVVIGKTIRSVSRQQAMEVVAGYCCGNDVSARDWQKGKPGGQWLLGKTFDDFAPIGPWFVTTDEVDEKNLDISLHLNGQMMQSSNSSRLMFPIDFLISHLSRFCTLHAGDLLFTGTPAGVGAGRDPQVFLKNGDETVVEVAGLGKLRNRFVAEATS